MRKSFFKVVSMALAVIMSIGVMAGCGKKFDKDEQGRTILEVGNWPSNQGAKLETETARKESFEAENTDVVIVPDHWSFDRKTFYAKAAGGQLPALYPTGFTEVGEIIESGYSADLSKVLSKRGYDGMFNEMILDIISDEKGKIKAFPTSAYVLGVACNMDLMKEAGLVEADGTPKQPKDWNEMTEFAVQIKEKTGKSGIVFPTANNSGGWIFSAIAWSFGVDFMEQDEDGNWKATFNTPEAVEALQWYKDLKWKYDVLPSNTLVDGEEWYKTLGSGNAAMTVAAGDYTKRVAKYGMTPDQVGMMAIPKGPARHVTLLGGEVFNVNSDCTDDQIDAAVRWFETAYNYKLTDVYKTNTEASILKQKEKNQHIGIMGMSVWSSESEALNWLRDYTKENASSNINHVRLYNEFVENCPCEIQPEEPVCCQELYAILDGCIQEVLVNKDADCAMLIEKAAQDFQKNYLDNLL